MNDNTTAMPCPIRPAAFAWTLLLVGTVLTGCSDSTQRNGSADAAWAGSIDTIAGRVVVRNPAEPIWRAGRGWQLAPDLQVGAIEGTGADVFGNIVAIAVSPAGEIAVLDGMAREVRVFAADGRHVRTIGRQGSGPGELEGPLAVHYDSNGRLWVPDAGTGRYNVFGGDGTFITSMTRAAGVVMGNPGVMSRRDELIDPSSVVEPDGTSLLPIRLDIRSRSLDTLPPLRTRSLRGPIGPPPPAALGAWMPRVVSTFDPDGTLWFAATDSLTIYQRSPAGDTVRVIHWARPPRTLARQEEDAIAAIIAGWRHPVDRAALRIGPQQIRSLHADDRGFLFVRAADADADVEARRFEVFDPEGRYLGTLTTPLPLDSRPPPLFVGDHVYGVTRDELDVPHLVRLRLERRTH